MNTNCPCGSNVAFAKCCQPLLEGAPADGPEALMRSRYTAYTLKNMDYITETTDPQTRHLLDVEASRQWAESCHFTQLEVLTASVEANKGKVEFKAQFKDENGEMHLHHEISKFRRQAGRWYFRDGKVLPPVVEKDA